MNPDGHSVEPLSSHQPLGGSLAEESVRAAVNESGDAALLDAYSRAVIEVIYALNREFYERVDPAQLATADIVLRAVIEGDSALAATAAQIQRPPSPT